MKLAQDNFPIQVSGAEAGTSDFKIAFNAKAFRVLSDTLYNDKIGSVVRETATNAVDSHIMASKADVPFEIHLPDAFEPWFSIKDEGIGLSKQAVHEIYTTYFMSTKDQSNECTGMLGLGSKVSFSYTDQFTIESNFDGVKTIYSAFINASGIPNIAEMFSEATDDPTGVEIKISVKQGDYTKFANAVKEQLKFFKVKPNVINVPYAFEFDKEFDGESLAVADGFKLVKSPNHVRTWYIVQGNVGYPLDVNRLANCTAEAASFVNRLVSIGSFYIECPIGSIGVTASRESVEYTDATIKAIETRLLAIREELLVNAEKDLKGLNNWEIAVRSNEFNLFGDYDKFFNDDQAKPWSHHGSCKFLTSMASGFVVKERIYSREYFADKVQAKSDTTLLVIDECTYQKNRLKKYSEEVARGNSFVTVAISDKSKSLKDLTKLLGGFNNFVMLSSIEYKPQRAARTTATKTACWLHRNGIFPRSWTKAEEAPSGGSYVYVVLDKLAYADHKDIDNVRKYESLSLINSNMPKIIGVRKSDVSKLAAGVKPLSAYIAEEQAKVIPFVKKYLKRKSWSNAINIGISAEAVKGTGTKLERLMTLKEKLYGSLDRYSSVSNQFINEAKVPVAIRDSLTKVVSEEKAKYPILKVDNYYLNNNLTASDIKALLAVQV